MMYSIRNSLALAATAVITAFPATMSDPVAVYAVIDKVELAPDATNPTTIKIYGRFAMSDKKPGDHYGPVVRGYLYYRLDPAKDRVTRAEWADLAAAAATKSSAKTPMIVGFGAKWVSGSLGRIRCATEAATSPDPYPDGESIGVVKVAAQRNSGWQAANALLSDAKDASACKDK